jgi:hypothetical protein
VDGSILPVCDYDLDNQRWSGKAILNSITLALWEMAEKDIGVNTSRPIVDNQRWSGKAILNSITLALWETVEKDIGVNTSSRPKAFTLVMSKLQQVSSTAVRTIVDELKGLSLLKQPGQVGSSVPTIFFSQ